MGMNDDVEALIRSWRNEVAREQIVCLLVDLIWVVAADVAVPQSLLTDGVRNIEKVEFVGNIGLVDQRTHPAAPLHRVSGKIQNDRKVLAKDANHVRSHGVTKPSGQAPEVIDGPVFYRKQGRHPVIQADQQSTRAGRQLVGER